MDSQPCSYYYQDKPASHVGMSGVFDDLLSVGTTALNAVVPGVGTGVGALVDVVGGVVDGGSSSSGLSAFSSLTSGFANLAEVVGGGSVGIGGVVNGRSVEEPAVDRLAVPEFVQWRSWNRTDQVDPMVAHHMSLAVMGPYTRAENLYRSHKVVPAIQAYQTAQGVRQPIQTHGHMIAVRTPRGGVVPIGMILPEGVWVSFSESTSGQLQQTIEETRISLAQARANAVAQLGASATGVVSIESPGGRSVSRPSDAPSSESSSGIGGIGTLAVLGGLGWLLMRWI